MKNTNELRFLLLPILLAWAASAPAQCIAGDCQDGSGTFLFPGGNRYEGSWKDGQRVKGDLYYVNGDHYTGYFQDNERHGPGIYRYRSGNRFEGIFTNGDKVEGTFLYANGNRYEGQYRDNKKNGRGTMYLANGETLSGFWVDNDFRGQPDYSAGNRQTFAVIVGVSDYADNQVISDLQFCDDDAYAFRRFLMSADGGAVPADNITLLLDSRATRSAILRAMREQFAKAGPADKVVFYFSGHGAPGFFCPYDTGPDSFLEHTEVKKAFRRSRAGDKVCLADACNSGSIRVGGGRRTIGTDDEAVLLRIEAETDDPTDTPEDPKVAVFMSSRKDEYSQEGRLLEQGVFTYFLVSGMKGLADADNDLRITYGELFDYVHRSVSRHTSGRQHPVLSCNQCKESPLIFLR